MDITPFTIDVPEAEVRDLRARLANTRWPTDVATDWSRGTPVSYARTLVDRWASQFDWASQQERLNTFPQFIATVDGQPIHFVHVRSAITDATPVLLAHGYPSSFVEFSRMIGPLVDPEAHGGRAEDAFHVVIPSLPGFGFSTPATARRPPGPTASSPGFSCSPCVIPQCRLWSDMYRPACKVP